jgi:hypothetical protein
MSRSFRNSMLSSDNSSTAAINTGSNFTGQWEDVGTYNCVVVSVATDQNGYYEIQFSPDGTNVDSTLTRYYRTSQINVPHRFTITRRYFRVVFYNNSGTNQTYFRLQTIYGDKADLNIPVDATMSQDYDAISVRPTDFTTEVALNRRQGVSTWNKFGYNEDIDTADGDAVIASWGPSTSGVFTFLTTGETIDIVSDNVADDDGSTGVNSIVVYGVDENWDEQTEVVTMDGTTTVTTSSQWIGINRIAIFLAGTGQTNAGTITISSTTSSAIMAEMPAGGGVTQQAIFYIPRNYQFLGTWLWFNALKSSGGGSPEVTFKGMVYSAVNNAIQEVYRDGTDTAVSEHLIVHPPEPFPIGEKSILWFTADTSANDTSVRCRFSGKLVRDVDG